MTKTIPAESHADTTYYIFLLLFALSGFSGLIYESIWTHYLKLFLGHAAYAQALVLVIFMGGMALGSALASRYGYRIVNILRAYAVVEALVGVAALCFHVVYTHALDYSYTHVLPVLTSPATVTGYKWSVAACLILPQSLLLGATFPFMSAGIVRRHPARPGYSLAALYFCNSLGAAIGVLVSGFILVPLAGLPGTMGLAGMINLVLAGIVWRLARDSASPAAPQGLSGQPRTPRTRAGFRGMLLVAAGTGAASFMYEIGWIRMLNLVLGSTTHSFELMLSAFILGLALGGLAIRRRIDRFRSPLRALAWIQMLMGIFAAATLAVYNGSFEVMGFAVQNLPRTDAGYLQFNLLSHGIALAVMLPATICAGMTLPLITYYLIHAKHGESAIGAVYASNTLGSIAGTLLAVQTVMPRFGLKSVILLGVMIDVGLGMVLLMLANRHRRWITWSGPAAAVAATIAAIAVTFRIDPLDMASGVYIQGEIDRGRHIRFQRDGKTASITFLENGDYTAVTTNGKVEAALHSSAVSKDEPTMVLLGLLPLALHPEAERVATIGIGSGLTTHTLLDYPGIAEVDTIEIEPAMVEAARHFGPRVSNTFTDQRSRIHIDDAKAFFTNYGHRYDLVISEPSNPWVSGVAGLFSSEFYALVRRYIRDDGLLVQWLHLYHLDDSLVATVVEALSPHFRDYAIYALNLSDIVIVATKHGSVPEPGRELFRYPRVRKDFARVGVESVDDLDLRLLGTRKTLAPFFASFDVPANSDYHPYLDFAAVKARYLHDSATSLLDLGRIPAPFTETLGLPARHLPEHAYGSNHFLPLGRDAAIAEDARAFVRALNAGDQQARFSPVTDHCHSKDESMHWIRRVHALADATLPFFGPHGMTPMWQRVEASSCLDFLTREAGDWIALYRALDARDHREILRAGNALLPAGRIDESLGNEYLVAAIMLSNRALGNADDAGKIWDRYPYSDNAGVMLRYIHALLAAE